MITCDVLLDSISPDGHRLTTFVGTFHRFVLAEFNTHRAFSRNSASSRAIPIKKQIERIQWDAAFPIEWAYNQAGMQAAEPLSEEDEEKAFAIWTWACETAIQAASELDDIGVHKQWVNRLLEPFMWHTAVFTSTEEGLDNFFAQRCRIFSPLAQPEIGEFADRVQEAYITSKPTPIEQGEWHLPFIQSDEQWLPLSKKIAISVARCARVSYLTHDGKRDIHKDLELYRKLDTAQPPHESPMEHVATPDDGSTGNFQGWQQWRHAREMSQVRAELQAVVDSLAA